MKYLNFTLVLLSFIIISCGSGGSGLDPHLNEQELQEVLEINLVGKWKIQRPSCSSKNTLANNSCNIVQIEFLENQTYLLNISYLESSSSELINKLFKGKYDIKFSESDGEVDIERVVLMGTNYNSSPAVPSQGSIATITEIVFDEEADDISFNIKLETGTSAICNIDSTLSLEGDKEEQLEPNAPKDSNHIKIQQEWRVINVSSTVENNATIFDVCSIFLDEYYDRCYEEETDSFSSNCSQPDTLTLLFSSYGTYLFTYYDAAGQILSSEEGEWRWVSGTTAPYTNFQVRFEDESWDNSSLIVVDELSETTFSVQQTSTEQNENNEDVVVTTTYNFQLSSLPYSSFDCQNISNK